MSYSESAIRKMEYNGSDDCSDSSFSLSDLDSSIKEVERKITENLNVATIGVNQNQKDMMSLYRDAMKNRAGEDAKVILAMSDRYSRMVVIVHAVKSVVTVGLICGTCAFISCGIKH